MEDKIKKIKIGIIGTGLVGMSYAYSLLNQSIGDEIVLVDINQMKASGEALDLSHGLAFCPNKMSIKAGDYYDLFDASIVVICAGVAQDEKESRLDLLKKNTKVMVDIIKKLEETIFDGIIIVATNPVDVLAQVVKQISKYDYHKIIGSGTLLDTARLRYELSLKLNIDPKIVHAYILGEHGDSEFLCLSNAYISVKPLLSFVAEGKISLEDLSRIKDNVVNAAYEIIKKKQATYYAIGLSLARLTKAILNDENTILPVSVYTNGEYEGITDVYLGLPCIINKHGAMSILVLELDYDEKEKLSHCAQIVKQNVLACLVEY